LPNFTGFASASIKYHLVSPVTNANYPLTVNASQVQGRIDGNAPTAGYIGQVVSQIGDMTTTSIGAETDVANSSITLSPGTWLLRYDISGQYATGTTSGNAGFVAVFIANNSNTEIGKTRKRIYAITRTAAAMTSIQTATGSTVVSISSSTLYKLRTYRTDISGTGTGEIRDNDTHVNCTFYAVRIA